MSAALSGKWVWAWNWRRCDGGDAAQVASRLLAAGCAGALLKAFDGPRWFDQGKPWRDIARELSAAGVAVGGWGYLYGQDPAGEARKAIETVTSGKAALLVLDVEAEFKGRPQAAAEVCLRIREALGPDYPLYFSSFAIARYHRAFPFEIFRRYCTGAVPQVYWNAFRWPLEQSLAWTYEDYAALGIPPERVFPAGGLYQEGFVTYPTPDDVQAFVRQAGKRGSPGVSFWSYEHMSEGMWSAVGRAPAADICPPQANPPQQQEEPEMSSQEFQQLSASLSQVNARIDRLEAQVGALAAASFPGRTAAPPPAGPEARYHIVGPEGVRGLWGVAERLGVPGPEIPAWIGRVKQLNRMSGDNPVIHVGDRLELP